MYGNNQYMIDNLTRQREKLDDMIKNYQQIPQAPVNNFINTGQVGNNLYELKKLNDGDEVENIAILKDTIFIGEDRLQIKKLDGTIEKYDIKKTYPRDKKDDEIDNLNKKIKELEERLNESEPSNASSKSVESSTEQTENVGVDDKSTTKRASSRISKVK